jgi:DNA-binding MarR family transcriptional regulator
MTEIDVHDVAGALHVSIGLFSRRLRQVPAAGDLTLSESSVLVRLDRGGPATAAALAKLERISPQSVGATISGLEARGLVARCSDPDDGRRMVLSLTDAGLEVLRSRRSARAEHVARALSTGFSPAELDQLMAAAPLIERLAQNI